jgi:2-C-methyl-D-erythritol 4-phosphate cytidylyltransferase / 2-C-methyl-D-erythritol 2,4-cyclodiphosphate synthase
MRCSYHKNMDDQTFSACAIIVAGGRGTRARDDNLGAAHSQNLPKQLMPLGGKPVIAWSIEAFARDPRFSDIIIVCPDDMRDSIATIGLPNNARFATSGNTRTASVRAGLEAAKDTQTDLVFIHDAARPGLDQAPLDRLFVALVAGAQGCAPARLVADALWHAGEDGFTQAQSRDGLLRVQTPQAFKRDLITSAYSAMTPDQDMADDIAVARAFGATISAVTGSERLDKITWPEDFARMNSLLTPKPLPRMGTGFDAHRFGTGEFVTLCGVEVPHEKGLAGHSDADVGWHALADAIYGALSAGDIGHHFPPSEAKWKGAPSSVFLAHAGDLVRACGGIINHVDVTLICEAPRVGPHREAMIAKTTEVLGLRPDQVSIKATTTEGMGFTGRREGIAAQASATILLPDSFTGVGVLSL